MGDIINYSIIRTQQVPNIDTLPVGTIKHYIGTGYNPYTQFKIALCNNDLICALTVFEASPSEHSCTHITLIADKTLEIKIYPSRVEVSLDRANVPFDVHFSTGEDLQGVFYSADIKICDIVDKFGASNASAVLGNIEKYQNEGERKHYGAFFKQSTNAGNINITEF